MHLTCGVKRVMKATASARRRNSTASAHVANPCACSSIHHCRPVREAGKQIVIHHHKLQPGADRDAALDAMCQKICLQTAELSRFSWFLLLPLLTVTRLDWKAHGAATKASDMKAHVRLHLWTARSASSVGCADSFIAFSYVGPTPIGHNRNTLCTCSTACTWA
jgi:hypothetical protein